MIKPRSDCTHPADGCLLDCDFESGDHKPLTHKPNTSCGHAVLVSIVLEDGTIYCESCFKAKVIMPLVSARNAKLHELSMLDESLKVNLQRLSPSPATTRNSTSLMCACGKRFSLGLDMVNHLADCTGPAKAPSSRQKKATTDFDEIDEIG